MLERTGRREPILISGAGKVVDGILRRRPCFFIALPFEIYSPPLYTLLRIVLEDQHRERDEGLASECGDAAAVPAAATINPAA